MEKRKSMICPICKTEMVYTRMVYPVNGMGGEIYRCPTREGENGCGNMKQNLILFTEKGYERIIL